MFKKRIILILTIFILLFSLINVVAANENTTDVMADINDESDLATQNDDVLSNLPTTTKTYDTRIDVKEYEANYNGNKLQKDLIIYVYNNETDSKNSNTAPGNLTLDFNKKQDTFSTDDIHHSDTLYHISWDVKAPKVGERVQFGRFYRDINKKLEPLEWIIIQVNKNTGTIVLMSHYGLHGMQYSTKINTNKDSTDYESSKVREWLTTEFYDIAFNSDEKLSISPFRLNEYGVEDMVYIPSVHQMDSWKINGVNIEDLKVMPTVYARGDGIYLYSDQKGYGYWLRTKAGEWYDDNRYWVYFYTDDFYGTYPTDIVLVRPCITIKY